MTPPVVPETIPEAVPAAPAPSVVPEPEPEMAPETIIVEREPLPLTCPACSAEVEAGDKFCSNCGATLGAPPVTAPAPVAAPPTAPSVGPRLVISASGAEIPLPAKDEILIGREDPISGIYPEVDLTVHGGEEGGVSRRHARLLVQAGITSVEDLDSTNYTFVNRQKLVPKTPHPLNDGDELRCGRVAMVFRG
jgi:hypothetical protein